MMCGDMGIPLTLIGENHMRAQRGLDTFDMYLIWLNSKGPLSQLSVKKTEHVLYRYIKI